jgi:hypothetical protein
MWISGKSAAVRTAKTVMASAPRLIALRHLARKRKRMAEIRVPA